MSEAATTDFEALLRVLLTLVRAVAAVVERHGFHGARVENHADRQPTR